MRSLLQLVGVISLVAAIGFAGPLESATDPVSVKAGKVVRVQNQAVAMRDAIPRPLKVGSLIDVGDVISTGPDARLEFTLNDGSVMTLGERTIFVVTDFVAEGRDENVALRLLQGAFRATTGAISKRNQTAFKVETENASIGIRGTTFWGGEIDGSFGVAVLEGRGVTVITDQGAVDVGTGEGTQFTSRAEAPSRVVVWAQEKIDRAVATVTFK